MSHKAIVIMIVMSPMLSGFTPRPSQSSPPRPRPALTLPKTEIALCCDGAGTTGQQQERNKAPRNAVFVPSSDNILITLLHE